jgi:hypothetical protein
MDPTKSDDPHGRKVHVLFNKHKRGLTDSRADAVQFLQILTISRGRYPNRGLILALQSGAQLVGFWVTLVGTRDRVHYRPTAHHGKGRYDRVHETSERFSTRRS